MNTRERILDSARRLLQTRSYAGFSFQDVADEVGIRKASIYSHFASKDELVTAALETANTWVAGQLGDPEVLSAEEQFERYATLFRQLHQGAERICPGGSFAAVWSAVAPQVQVAVQKFGETHLAWLEAMLEAGRRRGEITSDRTARADAEYIFAVLQGALSVGRMFGNARMFDQIFTRLKGEFLAAPKGKKKRR
ncbi:MAG: TetR/AcrR family transcriptional regulator [Gammaproteobacteria bacterium]|nr:TetR/AcrR family transcriptional regulator [Gammaproteobacteria bacterium]MBI5616922.1 TetR/AcrR family transcriptional regulator [Gammaproteobacteria bacterium]